jgi:hypothetical protein
MWGCPPMIDHSTSPPALGFGSTFSVPAGAWPPQAASSRPIPAVPPPARRARRLAFTPAQVFTSLLPSVPVHGARKGW